MRHSNQTSDVDSILASIFVNRDGRPGIGHLLSLKLGRKADDDPDFYAIQDDIVVASPNYAGTTCSTLGQSIVPVVARVSGESLLRCLGTGFFISWSGLLITATHVITDPIERAYGDVSELDDFTWHARQLRLGVLLVRNPIFEGPGYIFHELEWATFLGQRRLHPIPIKGVDLKLTTDIAVCKIAPRLDGQPHQPLAIVQRGLRGKGLEVGKNAFVVGYSGMRDLEIEKVSAPPPRFGRGFDLHVSRGVMLEHFPDNLETRSVSTPGPCFSVSAKFTGGMSGSPIFDDERLYVHGVVSKGLEGPDGPEKFGFGSMLGPTTSLPIRALNGATLGDLIAQANSGLIRLSVPDA